MIFKAFAANIISFSFQVETVEYIVWYQTIYLYSFKPEAKANKIYFLHMQQEHPRNLIPELCRQFYHLGWVTGTGGGISIKHELVSAMIVFIKQYKDPKK